MIVEDLQYELQKKTVKLAFEQERGTFNDPD